MTELNGRFAAMLPAIPEGLADENARLVAENAALKAEVKIHRERWNSLWAAYERLVKKYGKLASAASDVYDLEFEEDYSASLRRLRRVMKVCGVIFTRKDN